MFYDRLVNWSLMVGLLQLVHTSKVPSYLGSLPVF